MLIILKKIKTCGKQELTLERVGGWKDEVNEKCIIPIEKL